jgi:hypothetical protein
MMLALLSLGAASALELMLWLPLIWKGRRVLARLLLAAVLVTSTWLLFERLAAWTVIIAVFSLYRCLNLERTARGRIHADYLFHASRRTALWLIGAQLAVTGAAALGYRFTAEPMIWWDILASIQLLAAIVILASTLRHLETTRKPPLVADTPDSKLPSLTVAIPARNETADLEACLQSLTASTYPKLEIIVLDDCSQNKRTPEIIRGFAHDGVQFIAGTAPPESWLAKNYAYSRLAQAANGQLLLFCGVDARFEPQSLTVLVNTLLQKQKAMLGIMPKNRPPQGWDIRAWFMQPSRYSWELSLPRRLLNRPPVLSTCWLITRQALEASGGFQAVRRKGVPESYFARSTARTGDGYSFLQSDADIGITSEKVLEEQQATAVRTRYLQLHRRPELVAFTALAEMAVLVWPLILCAAAALAGEWVLAGVSGLSFIMVLTAYDKVVNITYRRFTFRGLWLLPLAALYDIGLLNYSMWLYEFREVLWKGRNVCIPIMQAIPGLPKST